MAAEIPVEFIQPRPYSPSMTASKLLALVCGLIVLAAGADGASARLVKVLPQFIDHQGRVALNPSLYERDAYQAHLRKNPEQRAGLRFQVQWKSPDATRFSLRVELRGNRGRVGTTALIEQPIKYHGLFSTWSAVDLTGEDYKTFGELSAWRATLWDGDRQVSEQASFLW